VGEDEEEREEVGEGEGIAQIMYAHVNKCMKKLKKNVIFMGEAQRDIRRKLQKLEGFAGMNASMFLQVSSKVFVN
jgi:hypothetical protein